jgi:hypothetical protein
VADPAARGAAIADAADALDAALARSAIDEDFALVLRACARGGQRALEAVCDRIADPRLEIRDEPALALFRAVGGEDAAARAVQAAVWTMVAQRVGETWPMAWFDVLLVAREAMPMQTEPWEEVRRLAVLTVTAIRTADAADREGLHFQFHRESLETVIEAATGRRPARKDMLDVISHWSAAFRAGIAACDAHLRELELERAAPGGG